MKTQILLAGASLALLLACAVPTRADSFFMYQGRLRVGGLVPEQSSFFDVQFRLFDVPAGGNQMTAVVTQVSVLDTNGLFRALVDLGPNAFGSQPRWLELGVRRAGTSNEFALLAPRQRVGPVPTSLHAQSADVAAAVTGVLSPANLPAGVARLDSPQVFTAPPSFNPPSGPPFNVGVTQHVANLNADLLDGFEATQFWRRSTNGNTELIGPNSNTKAMEFLLGADRALRLQPGDSNLGSSMVGGSANNSIAAGVPGSVVAGGRGNLIQSNAAYSAIGGGDGGEISAGAYGSVVGGGARQLIGPNSAYAGILGGYNNVVSSNSPFSGLLLGNGGKVGAHSDFSAVFSGENNAVGPNATYSVAAGGAANRIAPGANLALIASGQQNLISTQAFASAIVSGQLNRILNGAQRSFLGGGANNEIGPSASGSFLGGGEYNRIEFNAPHSTIPGGNLNVVRSNAGGAIVLGGVGNVAGAPFAIAGGHQAKAEHSGSIVLADGQYADFVSSNVNEFAVRAAGGVRFVTAGAGLTVDGMRLTSGSSGLVLPAGSVTATNLADGAALAEILDDDGTGSGLDADRLDGLSSEDFWKLGGNAGTVAGVNFVGTTDNQALELKVNHARALRLEPTPNAPNVIGGFSGNATVPGVYGAVIAGGGIALGENVVGARLSTIGGGGLNAIATDAPFATIPGGRSARARNYGQLAHASGHFTAPGDAQGSLYVMRAVTTNSVPQELLLDGETQRLKMPAAAAWTFDILLVATLANELAVNGYQIRGVVKHTTGGVTSLVGAPSQTVLAAEAPAWAATVEADDATDALVIKVIGTTAKTIRWVATVRTVEVVF